MAVAITRKLFTTADYHSMLQAGILTEDDRVELIDGEIIEMAPIGSRHAACVNRATSFFSRAAGERAIVAVQNPLELSDLSEPEPDVALLRPRADFYAASHPTPADVLLIVEVAEASADYDLKVKALLYARAGVPELWVALLGAGELAVHRDPGPDGYRDVRRLRRGDRVAPLALPDLGLDVDAILG